MGRFTSTLSILLTGIALGMNFVKGLSDTSVTYILLGLFFLNLVTGRDLTEKTIELGRQVARNLGLEGQVTALSMNSETTTRLISYLEGQHEVSKRIVEKYASSQNLSE